MLEIGVWTNNTDLKNKNLNMQCRGQKLKSHFKENDLIYIFNVQQKVLLYIVWNTLHHVAINFKILCVEKMKALNILKLKGWYLAPIEVNGKIHFGFGGEGAAKISTVIFH